MNLPSFPARSLVDRVPGIGLYELWPLSMRWGEAGSLTAIDVLRSITVDDQGWHEVDPHVYHLACTMVPLDLAAAFLGRHVSDADDLFLSSHPTALLEWLQGSTQVQAVQ